MEALARFATRRPVAVTVLAAAMVLIGVVSWRQLPQDLLPDIESPTVVVSVRSQDRPPAEMERVYGERIEQLLFAVRGIKQVKQTARTGRIVATVVFDWNTDIFQLKHGFRLTQAEAQNYRGHNSNTITIRAVRLMLHLRPEAMLPGTIPPIMGPVLHIAETLPPLQDMLTQQLLAVGYQHIRSTIFSEML